MRNKIVLDIRIYQDTPPIRVVGVVDAQSGHVLFSKSEILRDSNKDIIFNIKVKNRDNTIVATDSPDLVDNWDLSFNINQDLEQAILNYRKLIREQKLFLDQGVDKYSPDRVIEQRELNQKRGVIEDIDDMTLNSGHIAILVGATASAKAQQGAIMAGIDDDADDTEIDETMLPMSF